VKALLLVAMLFAACASGGVPETDAGPAPEAFVHEGFATLRPAMASVHVEPAGPGSPALARALYHRMIGKDYGVLALGAPAGSEVGRLSARVIAAEVEVTFTGVGGAVIYRHRVPRSDDAEAMAAKLLEGLPRK
jgi:hypothetical protein